MLGTQAFAVTATPSNEQPIAQNNHTGRVFWKWRSSARFRQQLQEHFEVRFRTEIYGVPYFLAESEAKQSDPWKESAEQECQALAGRSRN